jgi:D-serine deaminase-like pyridoxal phosphate-dependent protein
MAPRAPATERRLGDAALVLCAHGIRGGVGVAAEHAGRIAARRLFAEVHACALKGAPGLNEVVAAVRATRCRRCWQSSSVRSTVRAG